MLPRPPAEPATIRTLDGCAPAFRRAVEAVLVEMRSRGMPSVLTETLRTEARIAWLYGMGRTYDDGRGIVTRVRDPLSGWHFLGLAADLVHAKDRWSAPKTYWDTLGAVAESHGLTWGGRWKMQDKPHLQWARCATTPTTADRAAWAEHGLEAVWRLNGAL